MGKRRPSSRTPEDQGGHRVVIRPDTDPEANIGPSFKGAKGSYNLLVGDFDGSLGSGAKGWVVVDAGVPLVTVRHGDGRSFKILENGDPQKETGPSISDGRRIHLRRRLRHARAGDSGHGTSRQGLGNLHDHEQHLGLQIL